MNIVDTTDVHPHEKRKNNTCYGKYHKLKGVVTRVGACYQPPFPPPPSGVTQGICLQYNGHLRGPVTLTPVAECLAVELLLPAFMT